jgi:ABC-type dipeptide/oligopeptide/nickel transport system permease subunit
VWNAYVQTTKACLARAKAHGLKFSIEQHTHCLVPDAASFRRLWDTGFLDDLQIDVLDGKLPPGSQATTGGTFWLGTDDQGRDMLSAIFYGLRISLLVGATSTVFALLIGLAMGLTSGYLGGKVESVIMRIVDIQLSFPAILIALILIAVLGQGTGKVITALVTVQWAYYARTVRSAALVEKRREYMEAARCLALSTARIVLYSRANRFRTAPSTPSLRSKVRNSFTRSSTSTILRTSLGKMSGRGYPAVSGRSRRRG